MSRRFSNSDHFSRMLGKLRLSNREGSGASHVIIAWEGDPGIQKVRSGLGEFSVASGPTSFLSKTIQPA